MSSTFAPSVSKILLTLAFCSAKPIWIPRNPKLMFQISQNVSVGLGRRAAVAVHRPLGHCRRQRMQWLGEAGIALALPRWPRCGLPVRHPGPSQRAARVADVTVRRVMVTGSGLSNQFAPGPSAYTSATYRLPGVRNDSGMSSVRADSSVIAPTYQAWPPRSRRATAT